MTTTKKKLNWNAHLATAYRNENGKLCLAFQMMLEGHKGAIASISIKDSKVIDFCYASKYESEVSDFTHFVLACTQSIYNKPTPFNWMKGTKEGKIL